MAREWEHPKRDLLDIERTAQAESVEAADALADMVEAVIDSLKENQPWGVELLRTVRAYRIARGQDTE